MEQLDPNNPQRYEISLSAPNRLNYSQSFGYKTNVISVLVIIIHRAVDVARTRSACFDLHWVEQTPSLGTHFDARESLV